MNNEFKTERLLIDPLVISDVDFIFEMLNSEGWLKNIGDRHIHSKEDALNYVKRIHENPNYTYWVVRLATNLTPIGIISYIKRDYLENYDIGFALLPEFQGLGFAFEATKEVLLRMIQKPEHSKISAITLPENLESINLLQKLGLQFVEKIQVENESLCLYVVDKLHLFKSRIS